MNWNKAHVINEQDDDAEHQDEEARQPQQHSIHPIYIGQVSMDTYLPISCFAPVVGSPILPISINLTHQLTSVVTQQLLFTPVTTTGQLISLPHAEGTDLTYVYQTPSSSLINLQLSEDSNVLQDNKSVFPQSSPSENFPQTPPLSSTSKIEEKTEERRDPEPLDLRVQADQPEEKDKCATPVGSVDSAQQQGSDTETAYMRFMKSIYNAPSTSSSSSTNTAINRAISPPASSSQSGSSKSQNSDVSSTSYQHQQPPQVPRKNLKITLKQLQESEKDETDQKHQSQNPDRKRLDEAGKKTPYTCSKCSSSFTKRSSWRRHEFQHTGQRPHQCTYCQSKFKLKHHLEEHIRKHTNEKPFQCPNCLKKFSHSGSYSQHMKKRYPRCSSQSESPS